MLHQAKNKTHPIPTSFPNMKPRPNMRIPRMNLPSLIKRRQNMSRLFWGHSCFMHALLTVQF